jgi:hypothetical protein
MIMDCFFIELFNCVSCDQCDHWVYKIYPGCVMRFFSFLTCRILHLKMMVLFGVFGSCLSEQYCSGSENM